MTERELQAMIAEHIRTRGVTRCPVAVSVPSAVPITIPAEDAAVHAARFDRVTDQKWQRSIARGVALAAWRKRGGGKQARTGGRSADGRGASGGHPGGAAA